MSRRVVVKQELGPSNPPVDTYVDRVIKYIPADVVAAWVAVVGIVDSAKSTSSSTVLWCALAFGLIFTFLWTLRQTKDSAGNGSSRQALISSVAFLVWVFALGKPFESLSWYDHLYGSILLIGFTLSVALLDP
jgi:hypothetical protein